MTLKLFAMQLFGSFTNGKFGLICFESNAVFRINDLTASAFPKTKSTTQQLFNVQDGGNRMIKFLKPCPKVEWAGQLSRDYHFLVNTNSKDQNNLLVLVFNPNHGEGKFHSLTSDRLQNVFLYFRKIGDLQWSKARTKIANEDGSLESVVLDFAAEYTLKDESNYGYSSLTWTLTQIYKKALMRSG